VAIAGPVFVPSWTLGGERGPSPLGRLGRRPRHSTRRFTTSSTTASSVTSRRSRASCAHPMWWWCIPP